ncbi:hypothetical protein BD324DRAFT_617068 [Kockovaella imperatae]|uniref:Flavin reductase like domain-containing protein n=1 Tax=Kockovaella imperatae TaxID=4999 RepID=A0A1Y1UQD3_9TREE|nr:hypothetical protein BD324DRAFT_617068 [Kockovaella imperatae]ORX40251.1 hypothetical protein BD324DRAFT_617068 [Kockovaella imperatae]
MSVRRADVTKSGNSGHLPYQQTGICSSLSLSLFHQLITTMAPHIPFKEAEASRPPFDRKAELHYTQTPDPNWKLGQGVNDLPGADKFKSQEGWRAIDPEQMEGPAMYKMMISAIVPRPIALVSSMDDKGVGNLAPFSYFNMVSSSPPVIMISVAANPQTTDGLKDTASNIKHLKEFCVSIISEPFVEAANMTSAAAPREVEEWEVSGLTKRDSKMVKPPHVGESAFSMECRLEHWYDVKKDDGKIASTVILGRVLQFHGKEFVFDPNDPDRIMAEELRAVSRLGGISYGRTLQMTELPRATNWDDVKAEMKNA